MAKVLAVRPNRTSGVYTVTDKPDKLLKELYQVIGNGCDFIEAVNCGDGLYMLVDEEPFRRNPEPPANVYLHNVMAALGFGLGRATLGTAVFVGETADGSNLAGLSGEWLHKLQLACDLTDRATAR